MFVSQQGTVKMHDCVMLESATGVYAVDEGTHVRATSCHLLRNTETAILALGQATVAAERCRSEKNSGVGYAASDHAQIYLRSCSSDGDEVGCSVSNAGQLLGELVHVTAALGQGFVCEYGGKAVLKVCTATWCHGDGVSCTTGAALRGIGCVIQKNDAAGISAGESVEVFLDGCCCRHNLGGGLSVGGDSHPGQMLSCIPAMTESSGTQIQVSNSCFDENEHGIHMDVPGGGMLSVMDVEVSGSSYSGIYVKNGRAQLYDCRMTNCERFGLLVEGEGARIDAERCSVEQSDENATSHSFGVLKAVECTGIESINALDIDKTAY
jgi:hypothetical protein